MTAFAVPKAGADAGDCEDAFAISADQHRLALSDGATDSAYPAAWARSLVESFVEEFSCAGFESTEERNAWLAPQRKRWHDAVPWETLPWYGEEKAERGAFATFLGLEFTREADQVNWHAVALGDTCLVQLRDARFLRAFPVANSAGFTNTPALIGSSAKIQPRSIDVVRSADGRLNQGESIVLATDALGQWLLREIEHHRDPLSELAGLGSTDDFTAFVEAKREAGVIRNDDTTIILIRRELPATEET